MKVFNEDNCPLCNEALINKESFDENYYEFFYCRTNILTHDYEMYKTHFLIQGTIIWVEYNTARVVYYQKLKEKRIYFGDNRQMIFPWEDNNILSQDQIDSLIFFS